MRERVGRVAARARRPREHERDQDEHEDGRTRAIERRARERERADVRGRTADAASGARLSCDAARAVKLGGVAHARRDRTGVAGVE